ncbi:MAG: hypothetical protein KDD47_25415, partial [Acidobacteria bacterium]|nr:hypothetical protein [Acidobacteriota bacterium]
SSPHSTWAVLTAMLWLGTGLAQAQPPDTSRTPFRRGLLDDPVCNNQTQHCIEESYYFTYADSPPVEAAMEFFVRVGGLPVKVGPRRPDLVLQDPQLITFNDPVNPPPVRLGDCPMIDPGPPATQRCFDDPLGGPEICPVRELWKVFGYYMTVTYDPAGVQELIDPAWLLQCMGGSCTPNPRVTAPLISITTPASTGGQFVDPVDADLDGVATLEEICADSTLSFLQLAQISTLQMDGVVINVRNASVGGNHLTTDLIASLLGARYGQDRFSKFGQTPAIFGNGGSWGTAACLASALMHPELVQGCVGTASIPDVTEFKNHMIWDSNAQGLLTGKNLPNNDGLRMTAGLDRGLTAELENSAVPHLAQVISPAHRTLDMATAIFMGNSDGDFSSDAYGATNKKLEADLAALGKSQMYKLQLVPNAGHGLPLSGVNFVTFLLEQLYPHYLDVLANPPAINPFAVDAPEVGEDSIYRDSFHFVPFAAAQGNLGLLTEEFRVEDGGLFPGRWDAELLDLSGAGQPTHLLLGHGDGRVQLLGLSGSGFNLQVAEVASTGSQGFGVNGLVSYTDGGGRKVLSIDSTGEGRVHRLQPNGPSWDLVFDSDVPLQAWVGDEARIRRTRVFGGDQLFIFGSPPHFYQAGQNDGPMLIADPVSLAVTALDGEILSDALSYDDGKGLLLLTAEGYAGDVDRSQPLATIGGASHLRFRKISPFLGFGPLSAAEVSLLGSRYFLVVGGDSTRQAVLLDADLGVVA